MLSSLFKELLRYKDQHVKATKPELAQFIYLTRSFQEGSCRAIKLKYIPTGRMLRFAVNDDLGRSRVVYQRLEKTMHLVKDIHRIHREIDEYTVPYRSDNSSLPLGQLWDWISSRSKHRPYPVERPMVQQYIADQTQDPNQLYYGLITGYQVHQLTEQYAIVTLSFLNDEAVTVKCSKATALNLVPGLVWVGNAHGCYRISKLYTIRHHVQFEKEEYSQILYWLQGIYSPEVQDPYVALSDLVYTAY